jgi:hypothetical protein
MGGCTRQQGGGGHGEGERLLRAAGGAGYRKLGQQQALLCWVRYMLLQHSHVQVPAPDHPALHLLRPCWPKAALFTYLTMLHD